MPGLLVSVAVSAGETAAAGQKPATLEAKKMETTVYADHAGMVAKKLVPPGAQVEGETCSHGSRRRL
jgi:3-methylcrotonyl-CoA carboxylase alpha subunit